MALRFRYCLFHGRSLANDVKLWNGRSNSTDTPSYSIVVVDDQNSIGPEPDGTDIEVDGSFVGNTPSDIDVLAGDHVILVKKSGFKDWSKNIKVSTGSNIHIHPELEKNVSQ
jgi:PEGA domain